MTTGAREIMTMCGERLDGPSEVKYTKLRERLKKFINENATLDADKIGADYDENVRKRAESRSEICNHSNYETIKKGLLRALQAEEMAAIFKRLEAPSNPREGECL
jgi:hypothetical protein